MEQIKQQQDFLLKRIEYHDRKKFRFSIIYTLIPIIVAVVLIWFTANKLIDSQRKLDIINNTLNLKLEELEVMKNKINSLEEKFSQTVLRFGKIVAILHEMEEFIERKESFLRSLDEARFLINIRMLFDRINSQFSEIATLIIGMPSLTRNRIWITIFKSSSSLEELKKEAHGWVKEYGKDKVAIYLSPNKYYALSLKGDGSFKTAYRLTVRLHQRGEYGAYFAASKNWGKNLLE